MDKTKTSFGLVIRAKQQKASLDTMAAAARPSVFTAAGDDDDDQVDTDVINRAKPSASVSRIKKQAEREQARAVAQDPNIFDYDAAYDEIQKKKNAKIEAQEAADKKREPKYIDALLRAHRKRELEQQSRDERKQQKERVAEGAEFADKEVFVTGAYRKQMEEMETYREQEATADRIEGLLEVTKQKSWQTGFYRNILNEVARDGPDPMSATTTATAVKTKAPDQVVAVDDAPKVDVDAVTKTKSSNRSAPKEYRRRRSSSSSGVDDQSPRRRRTSTSAAAAATKKSIYSDESDHEVPLTKSVGGLDLKTKQKQHGTGITRVEQQRRFFTPTPPSSPDHSPPTRRSSKKSTTTTRDDNHHHKEHSSDKKSKAPPPPRPPTKEELAKARLDRLKQMFAARNTAAQIDEYRQRYFERKSTIDLPI